jgi:hypothetical protein
VKDWKKQQKNTAIKSKVEEADILGGGGGSGGGEGKTKMDGDELGVFGDVFVDFYDGDRELESTSSTLRISSSTVIFQVPFSFSAAAGPAGSTGAGPPLGRVTERTRATHLARLV